MALFKRASHLFTSLLEAATFGGTLTSSSDSIPSSRSSSEFVATLSLKPDGGAIMPRTRTSESTRHRSPENEDVRSHVSGSTQDRGPRQEEATLDRKCGEGEMDLTRINDCRSSVHEQTIAVLHPPTRVELEKSSPSLDDDEYEWGTGGRTSVSSRRSNAVPRIRVPVLSSQCFPSHEGTIASSSCSTTENSSPSSDTSDDLPLGIDYTEDTEHKSPWEAADLLGCPLTVVFERGPEGHWTARGGPAAAAKEKLVEIESPKPRHILSPLPDILPPTPAPTPMQELIEATADVFDMVGSPPAPPGTPTLFEELPQPEATESTSASEPEFLFPDYAKDGLVDSSSRRSPSTAGGVETPLRSATPAPTLVATWTPTTAERLQWFNTDFKFGVSSLGIEDTEPSPSSVTIDIQNDDPAVGTSLSQWLDMLSVPEIVITEPAPDDVPHDTSDLPACGWKMSDLLASMGFPYPTQDLSANEAWPDQEFLYVMSFRCQCLATSGSGWREDSVMPDDEEYGLERETDSDSEYGDDSEEERKSLDADLAKDGCDVVAHPQHSNSDCVVETTGNAPLHDPRPIHRIVRNLLNKLTPTNVSILSTHFVAILQHGLYSNPSDRSFIELIDTLISYILGGESATTGSTSQYALLCRSILGDSQIQDVPFSAPELVEGQGKQDGRTRASLVLKMLGYYCVESLWDLCRSIDDASAHPGTTDFITLARLTSRLRNLTDFLIELYQAEVLTEHIMYTCIFAFLKDAPERAPPIGKIASLSMLLRRVGMQLEQSELMHKHLNMFCRRMRKVLVAVGLTPRVRFEIEALLSLRSSGWKEEAVNDECLQDFPVINPSPERRTACSEAVEGPSAGDAGVTPTIEDSPPASPTSAATSTPPSPSSDFVPSAFFKTPARAAGGRPESPSRFFKTPTHVLDGAPELSPLRVQPQVVTPTPPAPPPVAPQQHLVLVPPALTASVPVPATRARLGPRYGPPGLPPIGPMPTRPAPPPPSTRPSFGFSMGAIPLSAFSAPTTTGRNGVHGSKKAEFHLREVKSGPNRTKFVRVPVGSKLGNPLF